MRAANRVAAAVLALLVTAAAAVAAVEIVAAALGTGPVVVPHDRWYSNARSTEWVQGWVRLAGIVLIALGLLLLVMQVVRRKPRSLTVDAGGPWLQAEVSRHSVEDSLTRLVQRTDGVAKAKAKVDGGRAVVWAQSSRLDIGGMEPVVGERVERQLVALHLAEPVSVGVGFEPRTEEGSAR